MDDPLDEDLKNRIKKIFDDYDDPSANEGWLRLREKFPDKKPSRRLIAWPWVSAAALLLLTLSFGLWKYIANNQADKLARYKYQKAAPHENFAGAKRTPPTTNTLQLPATKALHAGTIKNRAQNADRQAALASVSHISGVHTPPMVSPFTRTKSANINSGTTNKQLLAIQKTDSTKHLVNQPPANQLATLQPNNRTQKPDTAKPAKQPKSISSMFADDNPPQKKVTTKSANIRLGVYAGSYVNYAKGSGNQQNYGGGFTAEITIAKNLKLVTGVSIAQNSLSFGGGVPTGAAQSNFFSASNVPGVASTSGLSSFSLNSASVITSATVPAFKNYGVSLVGIDVPVNLKYEFNRPKFSLYFMAGLSSGTFLNETYTYQYNYPAIYSLSLQQTQNETSHKSFDSFYFGKMVNLAIGFGYPLGKNCIIFEPFLKYPLDGLGSQNIRFGAGGINLKFNFPTSIK